jgi:aspartate kinase
MRLFKFGGGTMYDSVSLKKVIHVIQYYLNRNEKLIIVVSAMGKTTKYLEEIFNYKKQNLACDKLIQDLCNYHKSILSSLEGFNKEICLSIIDGWGKNLKNILTHKAISDAELYHKLLAEGEILSSKIIFECLKDKSSVLLGNSLEIIKASSNFVHTTLDWEASDLVIKEKIPPLCWQYNLLIFQGFIGTNAENKTVTLGKESSDFTAAILAATLKLNSVILWKNVPGIMSADPEINPNVVKLDYLSYNRMLEIADQGSRVIHRDAIASLAKHRIPIYVKDINNHLLSGTLISETGL